MSSENLGIVDLQRWAKSNAKIGAYMYWFDQPIHDTLGEKYKDKLK